MRLGAVRTVAAFEFSTTVKRVGFLIATFGMPLFLLLYGGVIGFVGYLATSEISQPQIYGVIDRAGVLDLDQAARVATVSPLQLAGELLPAAISQPTEGREDGETTFRPYRDERQARADVLAEAIAGYYVLAADYLETGRVELFFSDEISQLGSMRGLPELTRLLRGRLIAGRVPEAVAARIEQPVSERREAIVTKSGGIAVRSVAADLAQVLVPAAFVFVLMISLAFTTGLMMQAAVVEKENRVVEILLSCVDADEILAGKLLGLGAAGLLQIGVWFSIVLVSAAAFGAVLESVGVAVPWLAMAVALVFFPAAYLFVGSLMIGTGSLGNTQRESQQFGSVWLLLMMVPMVLLSVLLANPHGSVAQVMTFIPFSAPLTVVFRTSLDPSGITGWEIAGAFGVMVLSTWLSIRFAARLFRIGLLLTGARPTLRQLLRQAAQSAQSAR